MMLVYEIILLGILIVLSAFFSGAETALVSISRLRTRHLVKQNKPGAKTLKFNGVTSGSTRTGVEDIVISLLHESLITRIQQGKITLSRDYAYDY